MVSLFGGFAIEYFPYSQGSVRSDQIRDTVWGQDQSVYKPDFH